MNKAVLSGKYAAYPEYKDSGVEWLGDVPAHWKTSSLRWYINIASGEGLSNTAFDKSEGELNCFRVIGGNGTLGYSPYLNTTSKAFAIGRVGALCGNVHFINEDCWITDNALKLSSWRKFHDGYLTYLLKAAKLNDYASTTAQPLITGEQVKSLNVVIPLTDEQEKIANFLDHETTKIDTLIEKQQQLIKLLKEKRQAVISHAVTKGLSSAKGSNAPMRDSGVEWLGEVPEHWIVRRLKHTSKLQSGIPKGKDLTGKVSISVPMLRVANVQDGYLNLNDVHKMDIIPEQLERFSLQKGDVLMNEGGDNDKLGRGAVWQNEIEPCIHQNHVFAIRPYSIEPEWLDLVTRTSYAKFHFYRVAKQSTNLASISSTNIKETPLVIPPAKERDEIIKYVNRKVDAFDKAEEKGAAQIALLQERRTALISAAVTGKIDVRNWVMPTPSSTNGATNDR